MALISKRVFDLVIIVLAAPLIVIVLVVLAVLVRFRLGSPVFFVQERPGRGGRPFRIIKFRTMTDARDATGALLPDVERLTRFGRLLRATSLDELPEVMNVVAGEMSLVGPRPLLMHYMPLYTPEQARRHELPPGITGWAQINGRNAITWEEKFKLDVWYVDNRSLALDVRILLATLRKVVRRDGINAADHATMPPFTGTPPAPPPSGTRDQA